MQQAHNGHPRHEHEHSDLSIGGVVKFLVGLAISGVVTYAAISGMWWWFGKTVAPPDAHSPFEGPREIPPQPRLQQTPRADLQTYLQAEQQRLNSYGRDPQTGAIHIPVDRALDVVAQRGLPVRRQQAGGMAPSGVQLPPAGITPAEPGGTREPGAGPSPGVRPIPSPRVIPPRGRRQSGERSTSNAPQP